MGEKLVIGPSNGVISKGMKTYFTPFNIDNDSFPYLQNAYQWRGRVKRKRGTTLLGRLNVQFTSGAITITLSSGAGNLLSGFPTTGTKINVLFPQATIVPSSVTIVDTTAGNTYTDNGQGILTGSPSGTGTINYATGAFTIVGGASHTVTAVFSYYPNLPVMGLEDISLPTLSYPGTIAFDTYYAYNVSTFAGNAINNISFYDNPATNTYPSYVQKTAWTPLHWNGANYQQFWSTNYQGAFWATNGIPVPFQSPAIGMPFKTITGVSIVSAGPPATATLTIVGHGLVVGDFVFINEVVGITGINFQTGYVITVVNANQVTVEFPTATLGGAYSSGGIAQYLTNNPNPSLDCIRWYNGDPTNGTGIPSQTDVGWVNFCPPLSQGPYSIAGLIPQQYYLVSSRMILPFKDRLIFIGPVIQSSSSAPIYLQDTVIASQNGTPFYTASFTGDPILNPTNILPILVPTNQGSFPTAFWEDQTGFGIWVSSGVDQPINTASSNEDVLIMGYNTLQQRFVDTGNDLQPFNFFTINSELGSSSTFSAVNTDQGVIARGSRGYTITAQTTTQRIDVDIPDEVFQMALTNNGAERVCAQRDFQNEWIYFTYPDNEISYVFPTKTLQFNYRDNSWGFFFETYTTYGQFRQQTGITWLTTGYSSWNAWNTPWNFGDTTLLQPEVIAGNQQGFILFRDEGTNEAISLSISAISGNTITSYNHCLNNNDYITISGAIGTGVSAINGKVFQIRVVDNDNFTLNPDVSGITYAGLGCITRMYVPFIATKQFPTAWSIGRKTRLGPQMYLLTRTPSGQIQLLIYLSQDDTTAYNAGPIVPSTLTLNDALIYSTVLYTCPESTNLGLTPFNVNLQQLNSLDSAGNNSNNQQQIWHRVNTSLIGDTVQLGFTMSDAQMRDPLLLNQFAEIEIHGIILDVNPSSMLT